MAGLCPMPSMCLSWLQSPLCFASSSAVVRRLPHFQGSHLDTREKGTALPESAQEVLAVGHGPIPRPLTTKQEQD